MNHEAEDFETRPARILLVEDNHGDVLLTRRALKEAKAASQLLVARSAEQALARLRGGEAAAREAPPDLILLDLNLPGLSGHDFLSLIKTDEDLRVIPVMVLSSSSAPPDVLKSYGLHANGYLVKPKDGSLYCDLMVAIEQFWFEFAVLPDAEAWRRSN